MLKKVSIVILSVSVVAAVVFGTLTFLEISAEEQAIELGEDSFQEIGADGIAEADEDAIEEFLNEDAPSVNTLYVTMSIIALAGIIVGGAGLIASRKKGGA